MFPICKEIDYATLLNSSCPLVCFTADVNEWLDRYNHDLIVVFNAVGKVIYHSKSVERKLGYKPSEVTGSNWYDKLYNADINQILRNIFSWENETKTFNVRLIDNNAQWIWFNVHVTKQTQNKKAYYITLLNDISYEKETEQLMITSEKMSVSGQLAASVAHEIRNPLTSLKGFVQLLQGGIKDKNAYYKIMLDEIDKMETITSELLFISRPLSNDFKSEFVFDMIRDVVELLKPHGKMKYIELKWTCPPTYEINCNRSQIKQVLVNLIKNALEAMEQKGVIYINAYHGQEWFFIDVIDEGVGISEDTLHKINDPFFTTKPEGTGLGLVVTQQILERHKGELIVLSNEGQGSTFRMKLPLLS